MIRNEERTGLVLTVAGGAGLLLVMLWLLGFFHEPELPKKNTVHATPRRSGGLAGEVADARTGRPVEGTTIELSGLDGVSDHWLAPADTERPLRFELKSVPAERDFTLEVGAPGYVTARRATRIAAGTTTEVGRIDLVPLAAISGTVVDANYEAPPMRRSWLSRSTPVGRRRDEGAAPVDARGASGSTRSFREVERARFDAGRRAACSGRRRREQRWRRRADRLGLPADASAASPARRRHERSSGDDRPRQTGVSSTRTAHRRRPRLVFRQRRESSRPLTARNGKTTSRGIRDESAGPSVTAMSGARRSFNDQPIPIAPQVPRLRRAALPPTHSPRWKVLD
jgi:hypothetical protein